MESTVLSAIDSAEVDGFVTPNSGQDNLLL
jgi:hypothetical protein